MSNDSQTAEMLAAKVAAILANSASEPGIEDMKRLIEVTESVRLVEQAYIDMTIPSFMTQTSNLGS